MPSWFRGASIEARGGSEKLWTDYIITRTLIIFLDMIPHDASDFDVDTTFELVSEDLISELFRVSLSRLLV